MNCFSLLKGLLLYGQIRQKLFLFILIFIQIILIVSYFFLYKPFITKEKLNKIVFFTKVNTPTPDPSSFITFYTPEDIVNLKSVNSRGYFLDFNSSMCFTEGTDIKTMIVIKGINWKCNCLQGWHGPECGYSEVLFRALLAKKQSKKLKGPAAFQRRLIYIFNYDKSIENIIDIRIRALGDIIDLFIIYENDYNYFEAELKKNKAFLEFQNKILYIGNNTESNNIWQLVEENLINLRPSDFIISSANSEILDRASLIFMKFYENIPEPIHFRLKWSVFGFFWIHPKKTLISSGACTVSYLKTVLNNDLNALTNNRTFNGVLNNKGIILGDLNHTGGWYCEFCAQPREIIEYLTMSKARHLINWERIGTTKITHKFIENLIEAGVYLDGKTELLRGHRYSDNDFAPFYVLDNENKFDFLLINFYTQNEYY